MAYKNLICKYYHSMITKYPKTIIFLIENGSDIYDISCWIIEKVYDLRLYATPFLSYYQ